MNPIIYWSTIVEALRKEKDLHFVSQEHHETFKNNHLTDYGRTYIAWRQAQVEHQKLNDQLEQALEKTHNEKFKEKEENGNKIKESNNNR